mmetsp:Transcript_60704/g.132839  ORF Transcript_60704/g.132839 Transcript_60704/m.132839 type:complete len:152 (-) Transcript_60704:119-574(-)
MDVIEAPPSLQRLAIIDVPRVPLADLAKACNLRCLMFRGTAEETGIEALSHCENLEILRLTLLPRLTQDCFMRVFKQCRKLRVVDIFSATDVSDQILGCIMLNIPNLQVFRGSHAGGSFQQGLSDLVLQAFRRHFRKAKVFVRNRVVDSTL